MKASILSALLAGMAVGGAVRAAESGDPVKVLILTGGHGFERDAFFKIFTENQEIRFTETRHVRDADAYERTDLTRYDAVVLYDMQKSITESQKAKFLSLFDHGIGLLVLHHALVSYQDWPAYERIIGGRYPEEEGKSGVVTAQVGYEHDVEIPVTIVARKHPITAGMEDFMIHDEIYWGFRVQPDVTPLISTTHSKSGKPLAWCRAQGKSRVVYLQLGHDHSAYDNPNYRRLVARSIRWVARR